jgi:hypothetical protein
VVLGSKKVGLAQAHAVILRDLIPGAAKFEIRTRDHGLYRANTLRLQPNAVLVSDPALPATKLADSDILELRVVDTK